LAHQQRKVPKFNVHSRNHQQPIIKGCIRRRLSATCKWLGCCYNPRSETIDSGHTLPIALPRISIGNLTTKTSGVYSPEAMERIPPSGMKKIKSDLLRKSLNPRPFSTWSISPSTYRRTPVFPLFVKNVFSSIFYAAFAPRFLLCSP
jgi:hypothetical protein